MSSAAPTLTYPRLHDLSAGAGQRPADGGDACLEEPAAALPETPAAQMEPANSTNSSISEKTCFRKSSRKRQRLPEFLRPAEQEALLGAAETDRDRMVVLVFLLAGPRCAEMAHLRIEDIDLPAKAMLVRQGKGKKDRYVPLPDFACLALGDWSGRAVSVGCSPPRAIRTSR